MHLLLIHDIVYSICSRGLPYLRSMNEAYLYKRRILRTAKLVTFLLVADTEHTVFTGNIYTSIYSVNYRGSITTRYTY